MKKNIFLFLGFILSLILLAEGQHLNKFSPYSRVFMMQNKQTEFSRSKLDKAFRVKSIDDKRYVHIFIRLNNPDQLDSLKLHGVIVNSVIDHLITAMVPVDSMNVVAGLTNVKRMEIGVPVYMRMDKARAAANVDSVHLGVDLNQPYKGKGVVVGVVDNGFQFAHVNFYNSGRDSLRVRKVWNQNDTTGVAPTDYSYGSEYTTANAIKSAGYDMTTETHATHVSGIAAGADTINKYYGVAPQADLVFVSYNSDISSCILDGVKYIYDYASSVGKPAVVNLSLGSHVGPHDGTSTFDEACDNLQGAGRLLVGAAGNEGQDSLYIHKTFSSSTDTLKTFFKYVNNSTMSCYADIWGEAGKTYKVALGVYDISKKTYKAITSFYDASKSAEVGLSLSGSTSGHGSQSASSASGTFYIVTETNSNNNKANAYVQAVMTNLPSDQYVCLLVTASSGAVNAWSGEEYATFDAYSQSKWTTGTSSNSVGEIGGTGKKIISVGAYVTRSVFTNLSNKSYTTNYTVSDLAPFSSKGPTIDNRMKPDITAPGSMITSSYSNARSIVKSDSLYLTKKITFNSTSNYYGVMEGTSMATPFVTGVLATWLQANPELTPADVRTILQETAINDNYTGSVRNSGSNQWGYGKIDAWNGLKKVLSLAGVSSSTLSNTNRVFTVSKTGSMVTLIYSTDMSDVNVKVYTLTGTLLLEKTPGSVSQGSETEIDFGGKSHGVYIIQVTGSHAQRQNTKIVL